MAKLERDRFGLKSFFGDLPLVEARKPLRIQPSAVDIKTAKRKDPENCVFSKACKRMWNAKKVVFLGSRAYVQLLDQNGNPRIERFNISNQGQRMIQAFDAGKKVDPAGFILLPPGKSSTLSGIRKMNKMRRDGTIKNLVPQRGSNKKRPVKGIISGRAKAFQAAHCAA